MEPLSTSSQLLATLWTINNNISKKVDNKLGLHGINFTEFLVMRNLFSQKEKQTRRADLAESIGLTASGITRMLAPMERIGLIKKEKNDRDARVSLVKITEAGERVLGESLISINEIAEDIFSALPTKAVENLLKEISNISNTKI